MVDSYAVSDIAPMKNAKAVWDRTIDEFPSNAMGANHLASRVVFGQDLPVSVMRGGPRPQDAAVFVGRGDVAQESHAQRSLGVSAAARPGAESTIAIPDYVGFDVEGGLADLASAFDSGRLGGHREPPERFAVYE